MEHAAWADAEDVYVVDAHRLFVSLLRLLDHVDQLLLLPFVDWRQVVGNYLLLPVLHHPFSLGALVLVVLVLYVHARVVLVVTQFVL